MTGYVKYERLTRMKIKEVPLSYQVNDRYPNEHSDCTVRAYMTAFNLSYPTAHDILKRAGRKDGRSFQFVSFMVNHHKDVKYTQPKQTLGTFAYGEGSKGTWIIVIRGHALTIKDGKVVSDWFSNLAGKRIKYAWQIERVKYALCINGKHTIEFDTLTEAERMAECFKVMGNNYTINEVRG